MITEPIPSQGGFCLWFRIECGAGNLGSVDMTPFHQGSGRIQYKKNIGPRPVNLGGAYFVPERRGCAAPSETLSDSAAYPKAGRRVSVV